MKRCDWVNLKNPVYIEYHDKEWWEKVYDDKKLFEMLILEWAQAWLSWETVLNKRQNYKEAFDNFDVQKIANYSEEKEQELLQNSWIIRNKLKIKSAIKNAKAFIQIQKEYGSFSEFIWSYVDNKQIVNRFEKLSDYPTITPLSDKISADLKKRGMNFVGSTIIYSYLQAVWIINDHQKWCFKS